MSSGKMRTSFYVYDADAHGVTEIRALRETGALPTCPACGAQLRLVLTQEEAAETGHHAGYWCPTSESHVCVLLNLASSRRLWDEFDKRVGEKEGHAKSRDDRD